MRKIAPSVTVSVFIAPYRSKKNCQQAMTLPEIEPRSTWSQDFK